MLLYLYSTRFKARSGKKKTAPGKDECYYICTLLGLKRGLERRKLLLVRMNGVLSDTLLQTHSTCLGCKKVITVKLLTEVYSGGVLGLQCKYQGFNSVIIMFKSLKNYYVYTKYFNYTYYSRQHLINLNFLLTHPVCSL